MRRALELEEAVRCKGAKDGKGDETADDAEELWEPKETSDQRQAGESDAGWKWTHPGQIALLILTGHPYIHAPQAGDKIHRTGK